MPEPPKPPLDGGFTPKAASTNEPPTGSIGVPWYKRSLDEVVSGLPTEPTRSSEHKSQTSAGHSTSSFSLADIVVFAVCELIAIPMCDAGWHAVVAGDHIGRGIVAVLVGVPIGLIGASFHWWKDKISPPKREWIERQATRWLPVAILAAFAYVAGPEIYRRAISPAAIVQTPPAHPRTNVPAKTPLVANPRIEWNGGAGPVTFHGQYSRTGEKLDVYVEWGSVLSAPPVVGSFINWDGRRRAVDFKERFVRNAEMKATIGAVREAEGNQLIFQFGNRNDAGLEIGITYNSYIFRVICVSQNGEEESYLFAIVASKGVTGTKPFPNLIIDPAFFLGRGNI